MREDEVGLTLVISVVELQEARQLAKGDFCRPIAYLLVREVKVGCWLVVGGLVVTAEVEDEEGGGTVYEELLDWLVVDGTLDVDGTGVVVETLLVEAEEDVTDVEVGEAVTGLRKTEALVLACR